VPSKNSVRLVKKRLTVRRVPCVCYRLRARNEDSGGCEICMFRALLLFIRASARDRTDFTGKTSHYAAGAQPYADCQR